MDIQEKKLKPKVIKRYQNRKLYDTQQSCYVTLEDIAKMIRAQEEVVVIDNKTKNNITAATLIQIIFETEKKSFKYAPLFVLRDVIQTGNGSFSNYLSKLGVFPADYIEKQPNLQQGEPYKTESKNSSNNMPQRNDSSFQRSSEKSIEERVAHAVSNSYNNSYEESQNFTDLPKSEKDLNT